MRFSSGIFLLILAILAASCSKNTINSDPQIPAGERMELRIAINAHEETGTKSSTHGNQINDISIWAYEIIGETIAENATPAGYATATFESAQNGSTAITMSMLRSSTTKKYRFFAVANAERLGQVYKARVNNTEEPLSLGGNPTYKELSTSIFDAGEGDNGIMTTFPTENSPTDMPFTHWVDAEIQGNTQTASITIPIFRPVAKTTLNVKLANAGNNELLIIEQARLYTANNFAVPCQGFMFSNLTANDLNNTSTPSVFGKYEDVLVDQIDNIIYNTGNGYSAFDKVNVKTTASTFTGSSFLYENNHGHTFISGTTSTTSPDGYNYGAYYIKMVYSYGTDTDSDNIIDPQTEKKDSCYIPLPAIIRNRNYKVDLTFNISTGNLSLSYSVVPWETPDDNTQNTEFSYPTFRIWPVKKVSEEEYDYSKPIAQYSSNAEKKEDGAFRFWFSMDSYSGSGATADGSGNRKWTVDLINNNTGANSTKEFSVAVFDADGNKQESNTIEAAGKNYQIRVYPNFTREYSDTTRYADIVITYYASWMGGSDELLINSGGGGTLWSDSGGERYRIRVSQGEDLQ